MSVVGPRVLSITLLSAAALLSAPNAARAQVSDPARFRAVDLNLPDADLVGVAALNSRGQVAATTASRTTGESACFFYDQGVLTNIGTLGGAQCVPLAMNESGQIVGHSTTAEGYDHPFIYSPPTGMIDIVDPTGAGGVQDSGAALAINASGQVVGRLTSATTHLTHGFVYQNGQLTDLDPEALTSIALGVNDAGQIAGWRTLAGGTMAFRYHGGVFDDISVPGGEATAASLINAAGDVAGTINMADGRHLFLFSGGALRDVGAGISASAINDAAQLAGLALISASKSHAFVTRAGMPVDLGSLAAAPNDSSAARSINRSGHIVGWSNTPDGGKTGVISVGAGLQDLRTLLTADTPAALTDAFWINDAEQVAAIGDVDGHQHAYLLSPASLPTELIAAPVTVRYGMHPQLSATLTSGSTPLARKLVTFAIDDVAVGSAVTDDSGVAQFIVSGQTPATGDHVISVAFVSDAEYSSSSSTATLTVVKAHAHLVIDGGTFLYDGKRHAAKASATGALGETLTEGLLISYSSGDAPVGAGTYSANVQFSGDSNYEPDSASAEITVLRARLTVRANDASKLLGAANPAFAATYSGFVAGETTTALSGTLAFATAATTTSPVGTYPVTPSGLSSPNYDIRYADGTLSVTYNICVRFDQTRAARAGSTMPIKLDLCTASGAAASSPTVVLKTSQLRQVSATASTDVQDAGDANPDTDFRYIGPGYIFNLKTTGLGTGTWALDFRASGDPLGHTVTFQVR